MSLVGTADCVIFDVFSAKVESAGVVVDKLTGAVVVDFSLFVGEGPFDGLCSGLGKERFSDLPLIVQLRYRVGRSIIKATMHRSICSPDHVGRVGRRLRRPLASQNPSLPERLLHPLLVGPTQA